MVADGHELANHTWTHPWLTRLSDDAARLELRRSHDGLVNIAGVAPVMYRPPYGAISSRHERWIKQEFGYPTIVWSVDCGDSRPRSTAASVRTNILRETRPGAIILVHDLHSWSVDAMPSTLDGLLAKGFRFVTMSQLLAMSAEGTRRAGSTLAAAGPNFSPGSF
jgi:peptidoglycan/xylan/chitin deacetylase (PgdA/CDA1 family)